MSTKRAWVWTGRLVALIAAVVIPACGTNGGTGTNMANGIFWNDSGTGVPQQSGNTGTSQLWIDTTKENGLGASPIGIQNIVTSTDVAVYGSWNPSGTTGLNSTISITGTVQYIFVKWPESEHQLATDTGSSSITSRESTLEGMINGYRQQQNGNVGAGGLNGGLVVGNVQGIILPSHFIGTLMARGHCKHFAQNHQNFTGGFNPEGDAMLDTDIANIFQDLLAPDPNAKGCAFGVNSTSVATAQNPRGNQGRLGKLGVIAYNVNSKVGPNAIANDSIAISGLSFGEPDAVMANLLVNFPGDISAIGWTNMAIGHWRGGFDGFYWNIIFLYNPDPAN